jgi:hypothetical protein
MVSDCYTHEENTFEDLGRPMIAKKRYTRPRLEAQKLHVFESLWTESPEGELALMDKLRALYLLNRRPDFQPVAARITSDLDRRPCDWQKVVQCSQPVCDKPADEEVWYFLGHVAPSSVFTIELGVLCPDGKTRIAVLERMEIPLGALMGLFLLPKGREASPGFSHSRYKTAGR